MTGWRPSSSARRSSPVDLARQPERRRGRRPTTARAARRVEVVVDRTPPRPRRRLPVLGQPGVVGEQPARPAAGAFSVVTRITTTTIHTDVVLDLPLDIPLTRECTRV